MRRRSCPARCRAPAAPGLPRPAPSGAGDAGEAPRRSRAPAAPARRTVQRGLVVAGLDGGLGLGQQVGRRHLPAGEPSAGPRRSASPRTRAARPGTGRAIWPCQKAATVGTDCSGRPIWVSCWTSWRFLSMSILTSARGRRRRATTFSSAGVSVLQGPHQVAQKSTRTGTSRDGLHDVLHEGLLVAVLDDRRRRPRRRGRPGGRFGSKMTSMAAIPRVLAHRCARVGARAMGRSARRPCGAGRSTADGSRWYPVSTIPPGDGQFGEGQFGGHRGGPPGRAQGACGGGAPPPSAGASAAGMGRPVLSDGRSCVTRSARSRSSRRCCSSRVWPSASCPARSGRRRSMPATSSRSASAWSRSRACSCRPASPGLARLGLRLGQRRAPGGRARPRPPGPRPAPTAGGAPRPRCRRAARPAAARRCRPRRAAPAVRASSAAQRGLRPPPAPCSSRASSAWACSTAARRWPSAVSAPASASRARPAAGSVVGPATAAALLQPAHPGPGLLGAAVGGGQPALGLGQRGAPGGQLALGRGGLLAQAGDAPLRLAAGLLAFGRALAAPGRCWRAAPAAGLPRRAALALADQPAVLAGHLVAQRRQPPLGGRRHVAQPGQPALLGHRPLAERGDAAILRRRLVAQLGQPALGGGGLVAQAGDAGLGLGQAAAPRGGGLLELAGLGPQSRPVAVRPSPAARAAAGASASAATRARCAPARVPRAEASRASIAGSSPAAWRSAASAASSSATRPRSTPAARLGLGQARCTPSTRSRRSRLRPQPARGGAARPRAASSRHDPAGRPWRHATLRTYSRPPTSCGHGARFRSAGSTTRSTCRARFLHDTVGRPVEAGG